ncbi:putative rad17 cell cycle checkpoint protein [Lyophyllum shimeji]|uniref:Rad17 cell cycle checkpoint protein n=1 Tax=Lyophyllum shimeji TaxID=47721 RepID=A0A9P3PTD1_LYOSH|nr:putative rad17 cell cycle checkpoint protein [Lyophyllum shimeji]
MAPKPSQKKIKPLSSKATVVKLETQPPRPSLNTKKFNPLTAFKVPSSSRKSDTDLPCSSQTSSAGKGKARALPNLRRQDAEDHDDRMWVDVYEPTTEAELAVHKRKVEDVRRWLHEAFEGGPSGTLTKYRRILALTGPAGTAKTTTIRVLAREMGFEIMEWRNAVGENTLSGQFDDPSEFSFGTSDSSSSRTYVPDGEGMFSKFEAFLNRASSCQNLFTTPAPSHVGSFSQSPPTSASTRQRHIILLEDLPNIVHPATQAKFHAALQSLVSSPVSATPVPVVIIVSDTGVRGEAADEQMDSGRGWGKSNDGLVDIRTVLPRDLLGGPYVTQISFNPIAPTLMLKALQAMLNTHFAGSSQAPPSREILDAIVETANGDIRSAIMALQFACVGEMNGKTRKKKGGDKGKSVLLASVTRREQTLMLFHLLGKVLYNKRKGDPPNASASAKDVQKEKMLDAQIKDPPGLPSGLKQHERRASRINVDALYADSPIDSSLFSLYIHQNYVQFCDELDHCDAVADWLSWVDSSGGDTWYQANPHRFHLLTLGTMHSLPSPVARRSQKIVKPVFFECLQKEKDAWGGVRDARGWALGDGTSQTDLRSGWSHAEVAMELGGVLKARDAVMDSALPRPPASHRRFSSLSFALGAPFGHTQTLDETEVNVPLDDSEAEVLVRPTRKATEAEEGGWLDSDDIEEF